MSETKKKRTEATNKAFGLVKEGSVWKLVEIAYNLEQAEMTDVKITEMEDLAYAFERVQVELEKDVISKQK